MDTQFIHLESVRKMLREPDAGLTRSCHMHVDMCYGELSMQYFAPAGDKLVYARRGLPAIGVASEYCSRSCNLHPSLTIDDFADPEYAELVFRVRMLMSM